MVYRITDHPTRNPDAEVSDDGNYLLFSIFDGYDSNGFYYRDLRDDSGKVIKLLDDWDGLYQFLGNKGSTFFFETSAGAPLGRVIAIDLAKPQRKHWRDLVPQADSALQSASYIGDRFVLHYLKDAKSRVLVTDTNGKKQYELKLPGVGSVKGFTVSRMRWRPLFFLQFHYPAEYLSPECADR